MKSPRSKSKVQGYQVGRARFKKVIVNSSFWEARMSQAPWAILSDIKEFREMAKMAADAGATHMTLGDLGGLPEKSRWALDDPDDPYLYWYISDTMLFKLIIPTELKEFLPAKPAREALSYLLERCAICRSLGLKVALALNEPGYLAEAVYDKYPHWRGPRCDHPLRSLHPRFAPCADQPEVLDLYRRTFAQLIKLAPEIDTLRVRSNDSASGMCWTTNLYAGSNGPDACRHRPLHERVIGFFDAFRQGAAEHGTDLEVLIAGHYPDQEVAYLKSHLTGKMRYRGMACASAEASIIPVSGMRNPVNLLRGLAASSKSTEENLEVTLGGVEREEIPFYGEMLKDFLKKPILDTADQWSYLKQLANQEVGKEASSVLLDLWSALSQYRDFVLFELRWGISKNVFFSSGGSYFLMYGVAQRWLTRPFVPFPSELTPQGKDYYRKHQFQARSEDSAEDLLETQGTRAIQGRTHASLAAQMCQVAVHFLQKAKANLLELIASVKDSKKKTYFQRVLARVEATICVIRTHENGFQFQTLLDDIKKAPSTGDQKLTASHGDPRRAELYRVLRAEIDNTESLIRILKNSNFPVLDQSSKKGEEDIFILSKDLIPQLKKKISISRARWLDYNRLCAQPNL
jgi:hypothetical protein